MENKVYKSIKLSDRGFCCCCCMQKQRERELILVGNIYKRIYKDNIKYKQQREHEFEYIYIGLRYMYEYDIIISSNQINYICGVLKI